MDWDPERLCEEETAILLLNLMVNEVTAWQKETGRGTPETKQLVEALTEVGTRLRQTLTQTRGMSTPSPTLFPDLLAENGRDVEKIQSECDAYLQRFTKKLMEQEKRHAAKIETLAFKKFLIEFVRDFLFVEIAKSAPGNAVPKRLTWFLDLVDSEVIPIETGKTQVSPNHHKVKGACSSEFASGTIVRLSRQACSPRMANASVTWLSLLKRSRLMKIGEDIIQKVSQIPQVDLGHFRHRLRNAPDSLRHSEGHVSSSNAKTVQVWHSVETRSDN